MIERLKITLKRMIIKFRLYKGFKDGRIVLVNDNHRQLGKTTLLVKMSKKYNIPIFTGNKEQARDINHTYKMKMNQIAFSTNYEEDFRGRRKLPNSVFVDETVSMEQIKMLLHIGIEIKTGFYYNNLLK